MEEITRLHKEYEVGESLRDQLVLDLKLDGDATDSSGKNNHGKAYENPAYTKGINGRGIRLDASRRQFITLGNPDLLQFGDNVNFTISLWLKAGYYNSGLKSKRIHKILKTPIHDRSDSDNKELALEVASRKLSGPATTLKGHRNFVWDGQFSPNENQVITVSNDETARIWNTVTGEMEHVLRPNTGSVREVFYAGNGSRAITASGVGSMTLWDTSTGGQMHKFEDLNAKVIKLYYSPNGRKIVAIAENGELRLWESAPWEMDDLPGDAGMSWKDRFNEWNKKWITHKWATN